MFVLKPKSFKCPSYCPGAGDYSAGLLMNWSLEIIADGIVGLVYTDAYSILYAPTGGLESGFQTYLPPIVIFFVLYPKSLRCPSYSPGAGDCSGAFFWKRFLVMIAEGIVGLV